MSLYDDPDSTLPTTSANGLGSLADELGDLLGSGGDDYSAYGDDDDELDPRYDDTYDDDDDGYYDHRSDTQSVRSSSTIPTTPASPNAKRHSRQRSSLGGGGAAGMRPEEMEDEISSGLERQLAEIEGLALRCRVELRDEPAHNAVLNGHGEGALNEAGVIKRLQEGLQTLAPQIGMESGTQRYSPLF